MRITSDDTLMCSGETRELTAVPGGGVFVVNDGPGTINGNILTATGGGIIVVEYVVSQESCTSSVFQSINSKQAPNSRLLADADSLCIGGLTTLRGIPSGGDITILNGPGSLAEDTLTAIEAGVIELEYVVTRLGCESRDTAFVIATEPQEVDIEFLSGDFLVAVPETGTYQWLSCDEEYVAIEGATAATFTPVSSGQYAVVMQQGDCVDTSECVLVELTAVDDLSLENIMKLYPNPAQDMLFLEFAGDPMPMRITVADMQGQRIMTGEFNTQAKTGLSLTGFVPGVYLLTAEVHGKGRYHSRFIKI
jgi:hypothetical protein